MSEVTEQPRDQKAEFLAPEIPSGIENGDKKSRLEATQKLENILKEGKVEPAVAYAIRKQLVALKAIAIEQGDAPIVPEELGSQSSITSEVLKSGKKLSVDFLTAALNKNIDLIKASATGAGFEEAQMIMEQEREKMKKNSQN